MVSMHLLVLSAFRPKTEHPSSSPSPCLNAPFGAQCFPTDGVQVASRFGDLIGLNAPFGAQCFPTKSPFLPRKNRQVSMHLLVLSAFRPGVADDHAVLTFRSQCTFWCSVLSDLKLRSSVGTTTRLNAPFGAQCFPTSSRACCAIAVLKVSMHLLVLSAFRPIELIAGGMVVVKSQCTFWCSVLSDTRNA